MVDFLRHFFSRAGAIKVGGIAVVVGLGLILFYYPVGNSLTRLSYDLPFAWRGNLATPEIKLVVMDEKSASALNQPMDAPWDRHLHAQLVRSLTQEGARAILFDITFDRVSPDPSADEDLAQAMRDSGRVFLGAAIRSEDEHQEVGEQVLAPIPALRHAGAGWGLLVIGPIEPDLGVRQIDLGNEQVPAVTWRMARFLGVPLPAKPDLTHSLWLNYYGPGGQMAEIGYDKALRPEDLAPNFFQDKIVIVGGRRTVGNLAQQKDQFFCPYTRWQQPFGLDRQSFVVGMEIHATTILNFLHRDWLERLGPNREIAILLLYGVSLPLLLSYVCFFSPFRAAAYAVAASLLIACAACWSVWHLHVWYNWLIPSAIQTPVALFWGLGANYLIEVRRRVEIRRAFSLYLSPHMAEEIAEQRFDLKPGGKLVEVTMMFTDLKGFTALSEKIKDPEEISEVMISYFNNTTQHVLENRGTIIKYIGDAVFASWGAPLADDDHPYHAALAASSLLQSSDLMVHGHRLVTRIGVNTGNVVAGNLGSEFRFDYTLIGGPVNVASRLEGLNKHLGTQALLAEATWRRLEGRLVGRNVGRFILSGTTEAVTAYELLGTAVAPSIQSRMENFQSALDSFQAGDLARAKAGFAAVLEGCKGDDGPSRYYLDVITRLEQTKLPSDWNGAIIVEGK